MGRRLGLIYKSWFPYFALSVALVSNVLVAVIAPTVWQMVISAGVCLFMLYAMWAIHRNRRALDAWRKDMEDQLERARRD